MIYASKEPSVTFVFLGPDPKFIFYFIQRAHICPEKAPFLFLECVLKCFS